MAKYDWNNFRIYVAFLAGGMAPGTRCPHHDTELTSCYHDAFLTWGHNHNNIVLFYHDSPMARSHFMDPSNRAIKGLYCMMEKLLVPWAPGWSIDPGSVCKNSAICNFQQAIGWTKCPTCAMMPYGVTRLQWVISLICMLYSSSLEPILNTE